VTTGRPGSGEPVRATSFQHGPPVKQGGDRDVGTQSGRYRCTPRPSAGSYRVSRAYLYHQASSRVCAVQIHYLGQCLRFRILYNDRITRRSCSCRRGVFGCRKSADEVWPFLCFPPRGTRDSYLVLALCGCCMTGLVYRILCMGRLNSSSSTAMASIFCKEHSIGGF